MGATGARRGKTLEAHRDELIKEVLRQKEAAIKAFDEKLAKLGYDGEHAPKRSHHKHDSDKNSWAPSARPCSGERKAQYVRQLWPS